MIIDIFADMKRIVILLLTVMVCLAGFSKTPDKDKDTDKQKRVFVALATIVDGDTLPTVQLEEVVIYAKRIFPSARKQRKYDKLTRNVIKMYPISKEIKTILVETYLYMQTLPDDKARAEHLEKVEKGVWDQYLPIMKRCTLAQGKHMQWNGENFSYPSSSSHFSNSGVRLDLPRERTGSIFIASPLR